MIEDEIRSMLRHIEEYDGVRILYACESGSRSWGFDSSDSDYDVRFVFVHKPDTYLRVRNAYRDVIETGAGKFDMSGWDLRKTLYLYGKSNPSLLEWIVSPIVYKVRTNLHQRLSEYLNIYFSPKRTMYHYYHMAKGNYDRYLQGEEVNMKKYLYVLRPILACMHIKEYMYMPPVKFMRLLVLQSKHMPTQVISAINNLVVMKRGGDEMSTCRRIEVLHNFIDGALVDLGNDFSDYRDVRHSWAALDEMFRSVLRDAWGGHQ